MYPTFPKGEGTTDVVRSGEIVAWPKMRLYPGGIPFFGTNVLGYQLAHGDIVEFENAKTESLTEEKYGGRTGFVKRAVALPRDTIELRDGYVYINGKSINESYTAKPRSTYGGEFLESCKKITVPPGKIFVMGDNRKASLDSRFELGLVDIADIHYVLPWDSQEEYKAKWRDTGNDYLLAESATLDQLEFVKLLNVKRKEKNLPSLISNQSLSLSAKRRGYVMVSTNDFSFEATKSGVTMSQAVTEVGYQNILYAEVFTQGYYDAQELIENLLTFPDTKKLLFSKEYQDVGISAVSKEKDACSPQVVVVHLGGYKPPNYSKDQMNSWQELIDSLNKILPSWEQLKNSENIDRDKVNQLLDTLTRRKSNAEHILSRMRSNQWLTSMEQKMVQDDKRLGEEAERTFNELKKL